MSRAISSFRILVLALASATCAAQADEEQDQSALIEAAVPEVVIVAERLPENHPEHPELQEREVKTMIDSEVMLDLTTRLTAAASRT